MPKIRKPWLLREEFYEIAGSNWTPSGHTHIASDICGLTQGSIPFAAGSGCLIQDNAALFWDAAQDFLGVGVGAPLCRTHIRGAVCAGEWGLHPDTILLLENNDNVTLQFQCATNGEGRIRFCDDDVNPSAGTIQYIFADDELQWGVATSLNMKLTSTGLAVGWVAPTNQLHVYGVGTTGGAGGFFDGVMARFQSSASRHVGIAIDAPAGKDPYVVLSELGSAMWDIRNDASEGDEFNIRYQVGGANDIVFIITPTGDVEIPLGHLALMNGEEIRFWDVGSSHYVGFEAPALTGTQIWVLPTADALQAGSPLVSDAGGNLSWGGDVDLGAGNFITTGTLGAGQTTLAKATLGDDGRGLSSIFTLSANPAKSDGIAFYSEGHIGAITTDGPTYGAGIWLNIDAGATLGADVRALDIGIYEADATCVGRNAYGLAIHLEFDDTDPPAAIYPFRINCNDTPGHATPDALIFAPNVSALGLVTGDPGTADDAYLKIKLQDGSVYRIPLVKE